MEAAINTAAGSDAARKSPQESKHCRTNSRRGLTDLSGYSYPPVEAACRVLEVLRTVNELRIATVNAIHDSTGIPRPTVVRMLETLMAEGYVARDNLCGGYRVTHNVQDLSAGYDRVSRVIEIARPFCIDLTRRIKWPIGLGVTDGDAISIQFWTGTISPWAHTNTVLGLRPDFYHSAMGRAYLAFCGDEEREKCFERLAHESGVPLSDQEKRSFRTVLERARIDGFAVRNPKTPPFQTTTIGMPLREEGDVRALVSISLYRTAIRPQDLHEKIIQPLKATIAKIEAALDFMNDGNSDPVGERPSVELGF